MSVVFVSRKEWGAQPPQGRVSWNRKLMKGLSLHHTYTRAPTSLTDAKYWLRGLQQMAFREGYRDIEYNALIAVLGNTEYVFEGRWFLDRSGANGTYDANTAWFAAAQMGKGPQPAREAIPWVRAKLLGFAPRADGVEPHSRFIATACPGQAIHEYIRREEYEDMPLTDRQASNLEWLEKFRQATESVDSNAGFPKYFVPFFRSHPKRNGKAVHDTPDSVPSHTHPHAHEVSGTAE